MIIVLGSMAAVGLALNLWQWVATRRFPLHQRINSVTYAPAVTVLKPLKGLDQHTAKCLQSWFNQEYPGDVQLLFGVASVKDPVCELVRELIKENPSVKAQLVICRKNLGANAKVSTLIQLSVYASHETIVVSDADVLAPSDFLKNAVAPLANPEVGLVNSFYRLSNPSNAAMRWEAVAINADFWSHVLQGANLGPIDFALGAVMVIRREDLAKIGGFESLADYLADDYQLGNRMAHVARKRIALCPVVVDCVDSSMNWREVWNHQLRWARTIRVCKPGPYLATVLHNSTLWPLLWFVFAPGLISGMGLAMCLAVRIVSAQSIQNRLGKVAGQGFYWWLPPVKDLMQFGLWCLSLFGNTITWRGESYRVQSDGRLVPESRDWFGFHGSEGDGTVQNAPHQVPTSLQSAD